MPDPLSGRCPMHRSAALWRYRCYADPRFFALPTPLPEDLYAALVAAHWWTVPPPCHGTGEPGAMCGQCRFGEAEELTVIAPTRTERHPR